MRPFEDRGERSLEYGTFRQICLSESALRGDSQPPRREPPIPEWPSLGDDRLVATFGELLRTVV